jgi:hypothetical protein
VRLGPFARKTAWESRERRAPHPVLRGFIAGLAVGAVLVGALAAGAVSGWLGQPRATAAGREDPVLIVFSARAEDGARVAAFTLVLGPGRSATLLDPTAPMALPGVSATSVRGAAAFAHAADMAEALKPSYGRLHWAEIDEDVWVGALDAAAPVTADLPSAVDTFDGKRLRSYRAGEQTVTAGDVTHLTSAAMHLPAGDRKTLLEGLARTLLAAIAARGSAVVPSDATDLSPAALAQVLNDAVAAGARPTLSAPRAGAPR